ncbi:hypothetical protein LWI29_034697 [Acer saccharum]|uniref:Uncharacterized protein n=1 Tax=Acer saccharum TaxID=4024 RepID=A0AA39RHN6_ACESA|nr:hypothetical protein LWI29_034697 [Acer saccharum]
MFHAAGLSSTLLLFWFSTLVIAAVIPFYLLLLLSFFSAAGVISLLLRFGPKVLAAVGNGENNNQQPHRCGDRNTARGFPEKARTQRRAQRVEQHVLSDSSGSDDSTQHHRHRNLVESETDEEVEAWNLNGPRYGHQQHHHNSRSHDYKLKFDIPRRDCIEAPAASGKNGLEELAFGAWMRATPLEKRRNRRSAVLPGFQTGRRVGGRDNRWGPDTSRHWRTASGEVMVEAVGGLNGSVGYKNGLNEIMERIIVVVMWGTVSILRI